MNNTKIHYNYLYLLDKIKSLNPEKKNIRILDYGCGKGVLVKLARSEKIEIYGVEMFGPGSGINIKKQALDYGGGGIIKEIIDEKIPFADNFFDMVVSNQVFEHIPNLDPVIAEIYHVLKPEGKFIGIFPLKDAIREGHCEAPFVHWLKPQSKSQYLLLKFFNILGFGRRKKIAKS